MRVVCYHNQPRMVCLYNLPFEHGLFYFLLRTCDPTGMINNGQEFTGRCIMAWCSQPSLQLTTCHCIMIMKVVISFAYWAIVGNYFPPASRLCVRVVFIYHLSISQKVPFQANVYVMWLIQSNAFINFLIKEPNHFKAPKFIINLYVVNNFNINGM